jgi:hypothetical protein
MSSEEAANDASKATEVGIMRRFCCLKLNGVVELKLVHVNISNAARDRSASSIAPSPQ